MTNFLWLKYVDVIVLFLSWPLWTKPVLVYLTKKYCSRYKINYLTIEYLKYIPIQNRLGYFHRWFLINCWCFRRNMNKIFLTKLYVKLICFSTLFISAMFPMKLNWVQWYRREFSLKHFYQYTIILKYIRVTGMIFSHW